MSHFFTVPEPFCDPKNALKAFAAGPRWGSLRRFPRPSSRLGRGIPPPHTLPPSVPRSSRLRHSLYGASICAPTQKILLAPRTPHCFLRNRTLYKRTKFGTRAQTPDYQHAGAKLTWLENRLEFRKVSVSPDSTKILHYVWWEDAIRPYRIDHLTRNGNRTLIGVPKLGCCFLFVFYSNYGRILYHF